MMLTSAGICITVGAALSLRFNVAALVLAIALALLGIAVMAILHGDTIRSMVLAIISIVLALQAGYLGGSSRASSSLRSTYAKAGQRIGPSLARIRNDDGPFFDGALQRQDVRDY
jgi:hypothetical protein